MLVKSCFRKTHRHWLSTHVSETARGGECETRVEEGYGRLVGCPVDQDEFLARLKASGGPESACPNCGQRDWVGLEQLLRLPIKRSHKGRYGSADPGEVVAAAPACRACGHMVLIDTGDFKKLE